MQPVPLRGGNWGEPTTLALERTKNSRGVSYQMDIHYTGNDWLFIQEQDSLQLLVDGKLMVFSGRSSWVDKNINTLLLGVGTVQVEEDAYYPVTYGQLKAISSAHEVKAKIVGKKYYVDREFPRQVLEDIGKFISEYGQE